MVALLPPEDVDRAVEILSGFAIRAWPAGEVALAPDRGGEVRMTGEHPGW